jgi:predicted phosphodiesterase
MQRVVFGLALAVMAACGNVSGHLSSTQIGDTSHPAERRSPVAELRAACGDGMPTTYGVKALARKPYLQQVTSTSAMLGWVASTSDIKLVTLTSPTGKKLATAPGEIEIGARLSSTEKQSWSSLASLEPATTYCYQVADATGAMTFPTGFKTAPSADSTEPIRFLAFGDSGGGGADQYALLDQMYTVPYDLMIHTGDIAYDDGTIDQYEENVFGVYADLFRNIPLFPAAGNHDYRTLRGAPFREVFNLPGDSGEQWYSYDWGRVHFVSIDTEADFKTQAEWLDKDLAATKLPWKIVYMHRPMYSSGHHGSHYDLRALLEPVMQKHGVQLVLAGHDHNYERVKPQHGITHVVTGGGGVGTRAVGKSSFTAISEDVIHFVQVEVLQDELILHAIDGMGREFDSVVVPRA